MFIISLHFYFKIYYFIGNVQHFPPFLNGPEGNFLVKKFERDHAPKAAVPKHDEKPIHGLVSDKNFIVANAVENILAAPKLPQTKEKDYLKKKNFGAVPKYLTKIKNEIEDEYNLVREMQVEEQNEKDRQKFLMPESER